MIAQASAHGITVLGPNCLGFLNAHARAAPFALTVPPPLLAGPVGIALQSGALASVVLAFAHAHAIGVSTLATLGNEAMITATDVLEYLVEDDATRVICLFLEEIGDPVSFARAAGRAAQAGKPIVALKAGASPAGREVALAHTGAVAGDDAVVDAVLRQLNVIRVTSIEDLLGTAALLGYDRWPRGRRMGVVSTSGGACDLIADRAAAEAIEIPEFTPRTTAAITPLVPPFAAVRNPLDVTGYFLANRRTSALTPADHALAAAVADPGLDFVVFTGLTLPDARPDEPLAAVLEERAGWLGELIAAAPIPVITLGHTCVNVSDYGRQVLGRGGLHVLGGIDLGMTALGHALRWLERRDGPWRAPACPDAAAPGAPVTGAGAAGAGPARAWDGAAARAAAGAPWPETAARDLLARSGFPVVPADLAGSADEAAAAARRLGFPVVLKVCSAQIPHKSDVGGVAVGPRTEAEVRAAYARVRAAGEAVPGARVDGVLVSPMRAGGVELIAGVTVDPAFGPVLAVGLGGVWVEVLADTSLRLLPVDAGEVRRMLTELRGSPLLRGARGAGGRPGRGGPGDLPARRRGRGAGRLAARAGSQPAVGRRGPGRGAGRPRGHRARARKIGVPAMKLAVSTEQAELRDSVRRFLAARAPVSRVRELMDTADGTDRTVWLQAGAQLGLQGIAIPEEYGGAGFGFAEQAIVLEELGAALYGGPYLASAVLAATALLSGSDEAARRDLLPGIASGQTVATLAFTEDDGSWDPAAIRLAAVPRGRGGAGGRADGNRWVLSGPKSFVLDGFTADLILVVAAAAAGLSLFAVEAGAAGLRRRALATLDQTRKLARLEFDAVPARLVGAPGEAAGVLARTLDVAAIALAAEQLGGAQRVLDMAVGYAKTRHQFGAADRQLPGDQASLRRPAARGRDAALSGRIRRGRGSRGLGRGAGGGRPGPGLRQRRVLPRGGREHPDPRRDRVHLGTRRPPLLQAGQGQRAVPRRRQLPPRAPGPAHRPVTPPRGPGKISGPVEPGRRRRRRPGRRGRAARGRLGPGPRGPPGTP